MRVVGLDVSRTVAEIAYLEDGRVRAGGRVTLERAALALEFPGFSGHLAA